MTHVAVFPTLGVFESEDKQFERWIDAEAVPGTRVIMTTDEKGTELKAHWPTLTGRWQVDEGVAAIAVIFTKPSTAGMEEGKAGLIKELTLLKGDFEKVEQEISQELSDLLNRIALLQTLPTAGLEERMPGWLKGLASPEVLFQWIHRGHETLLGSQPVAVLFDPGLLSGRFDTDRQIRLAGLEELRLPQALADLTELFA